MQAIEGLSLRDTVVRIADSDFLQDFVRTRKNAVMDHSFLDRCLRAVRLATWKRINELLARAAAAQEKIDPSVVRTDTTVVDANIHWPTAASLLWDTWRVASRVLKRLPDTTSAGRCVSSNLADLLNLRLPVLGRAGEHPKVLQHLDLAAAVRHRPAGRRRSDVSSCECCQGGYFARRRCPATAARTTPLALPAVNFRDEPKVLVQPPMRGLPWSSGRNQQHFRGLPDECTALGKRLHAAACRAGD